jgi:hypothetical protein
MDNKYIDYDLILENLQVLKLTLPVSWFSFNILHAVHPCKLCDENVYFAAAFFIRFLRNSVLYTSLCERAIGHWTNFISETSLFASTRTFSRYYVNLELVTKCF